ncbi:MAG: hypothetical protein V4655_10055 [Bdellovibrionota bacterium]|nr:MAG: hypothetical protein EOP10_10780 [Pseudomonadota bacterium]
MIKITFQSLSLALALTGCMTGGSTIPGEGPVKTAPSPSSPRLLDCIGENQTTKGNTRPDCLPNKGDEAARDTAEGAGTTEVRP